MVAQSLASLLQRASIDDHEEVIQSCDAVLAKSKSDLKAQHMKVVALLKLDRYEEALKIFEAGGDDLKNSAGLEYAYASYKCGELEEATEALTRTASGRGASHLEAQVRYRAENFRRAAELYEELSKDTSYSQEVNDLNINSWATDAQLQWKGEPEFVRHDRLSREDLESFETTYNGACLNIAKGAFKQGEILLNRAQSQHPAVLPETHICRTSEDLSPEEKTAELLPIAVQQLYVLIRLGKLEEAEAALKDIAVEDIPELSTKKIARNNIVLARPTAVNPYILYKALHATPDATNNDRLFEYQDRDLIGNSHAADLLVQKYDGIIRSTAKALSKRPSPSTDTITNLLSVSNAAAHARNETGPKALRKITPLLERRPTDLGLLLTVVQLYISSGNTASAITAMERSLRSLEESNESIRFNPGLLSVLVSLYQLEGRTVQIRNTLAQAAAYWRTQPEPPASLLRAAAASLLHSEKRSDLATAGELFRGLQQQDANDRVAIAGYVASQATLDYAQIESQLDSLPAVSDLIADVDVSALESAGIAPSASSAAAAAAAFAGARKRTAATADGARKRVRKSRLPKDFDPAKKPDPERWLPVRDRSSYRPKGKKGKQRAAALTQGGPVNEKAEESAPQQQKPAGGSSNAKKNKKKGKR
ncbi:Tetratricopeptide-like helical [Penicillium bovifimosum]|uniref:Signal recognition particle subunit SRP72 n=1 Tax=Penicillium bovifimosum TaxID=126998 RepID=A0A9W9GT07_9EURO|nr:Tetratricopeptide-like helical [Penicillium bovifimosum]KAJ5129343.1 Tetratricopeptide-like helical [Penicillium bovifimosum]